MDWEGHRLFVVTGLAQLVLELATLIVALRIMLVRVSDCARLVVSPGELAEHFLAFACCPTCFQSSWVRRRSR